MQLRHFIQSFQPQGSKHFWLRWSLWGVGSILGIWLVAWLAVPPLLKYQLQKIASSQLGRQVTVGAVDFSPWSLELTLHDLAIAAVALPVNAANSARGQPAGRTVLPSSMAVSKPASTAVGPAADPSAVTALSTPLPTLKIARVYLDVELQSLLRLAPVIDAVVVDQPVVHIHRHASGSSDVDDLVARFTQPSATQSEDDGARFAFYNIALHGGSADIQDDVAGRTHTLRSLEFAVPFLSNLASQRAVKVLPHLAFTLNGSQFDSTAQATPFAPARHTEARLQLAGFDLAPYLAYQPPGLPVHLQAGVVDADLRLAFEQKPQAVVKISGTVSAHGVRAVDMARGELLAWKTLKIEVQEAQPLLKSVHLASVELTAPRLVLSRNRAGVFNVVGAGPAGAPQHNTDEKTTQDATENTKVNPGGSSNQGAYPVTARDAVFDAAEKVAKNTEDAATAAKITTKKIVPKTPWSMSLTSLKVADGSMVWRDETTKPAAAIDIGNITLTAQALAWPWIEAVPFSAGFHLPGGTSKPAMVAFKGQVAPTKAEAKLTVERMPLALASPYLASQLEPQLTGLLDADVDLAWANQALKLVANRLSVDDMALAQGSTVLASWKQLLLERIEVDLAQKKVLAGRIALLDLKTTVQRDGTGRWMFERWLKSAGAKTINSEAVDMPASGVSAPVTLSTTPLASASASAPTPVASASASASASAKPVPLASISTGPPSAPVPVNWSVRVQDLLVQGAAIGWRDLARGAPVALDISSLVLKIQNLAPTERGAAPSAVQISARVGADGTEPGRLQFQGSFAPQPVAVQGDLQLERLPLHALEPYFGDGLNLDLVRADASFRGPLRLAVTAQGTALRLTGDSALEDVRANSVALTQTSGTTADAPVNPAAAAAPASQRGGDRLLSWKALGLRGLEVVIAPNEPTRVKVRETALSDFFARVIVQENGRINLQDIVKASVPATGAASGAGSAATAGAAAPESSNIHAGVNTTTGAISSVAVQVINTPASSQKIAEISISPATAPSAPSALSAALPADPPALTSLTASTPAAAPTPPSTMAANPPVAGAPLIDFGPVSLVNGRVAFSDRFIRPNYSANLTELTGKLSAFSSAQPQGERSMADLELRGRAEGTASLDITGKLNPLAKPLALDIQAKVRDLELPPLSPYSVKYAGHGIERGKLSMDLSYRLLPNGQLTAANRLTLNQLTFGDPVPGAASSLPVRLAVMLLADRNGVIDLDLPISGSLNDPQFRLAPIIWKVIGNLVAKAVTSPFSLLGGGGGGASNLDAVLFDAGSGTLGPAAQAALDKVAQIMRERPALRMTVVGLSSMDAERDGYKRQQLQQLTRIEKRRGLVVAGISVPISPASPASAAPPTSGTAGPGTSAESIPTADAEPVAGDAASSQAADDAAAPVSLSAGASAITASEAEYPALLREVYKRADMPKPRNLVGLAKDVPLAEMEALLLANIEVVEDTMRELALRRASVVRDYLVARKVPPERLFMGASRSLPAEEARIRSPDKSDAKATGWKPHAELQVFAK